MAAMRRALRALTTRGRWRYRRCRWKLRRRCALLRRRLATPFALASQALFPLVALTVASAAILDGGWKDEAAPFQGPAYTVSDRVLAPYRELRGEVVGRYAARYGVPARLAGLIYETAIEERVDPDLAFRLVRTESSFHPMAVGPAGSVGLAQVKPSTARWLDSTITRERLFEATTNLRLGFRYLRMLLDMYDHDTRLALLAYNRGPGTVAALLAIGEDPGNGYASRVLGTRSVRQIVVHPPAGRSVDAPAPAAAAIGETAGPAAGVTGEDPAVDLAREPAEEPAGEPADGFATGAESRPSR